MDYSKPIVDAHCHIFNSTQLKKELFVLICMKLKQFLTGKPALLPGEEKAPIYRGGPNIKDIKKVLHFLKILSRPSSEDIFHELQDSYGENIIIAPLMMDLLYGAYQGPAGTRSPGDTGIASEEDIGLDKLEELFARQILEINACIQAEEEEEEEKTKGGNTLRDGHTPLQKEYNEVISDLLSQVNDTTERSIHFTTGFERQITELERLKKAFPNNIYPFLAVDPRRKGITELVKQKVGKGKPFTGIKIYPPLGYLPSHPVLMNIFAYCEQEQIPVTAHCSKVIVATLLKTVRVKGLLLKELFTTFAQTSASQRTTIAGKEFIETDDLFILPSLSESDTFDVLKKRSSLFADPWNWVPVLEKYNSLVLNLAHFGGGTELKKYMDNASDPSAWTYRIMTLLENSRYPNVYTDISHFDDDESITYVNELLDTKPFLWEKLMYGSDFLILMLSKRHFSDYLAPFIDESRLRKQYLYHMQRVVPLRFLGIGG